MKLAVNVEGQIYHLEAQIVQKKVWIHFAGKTYCLGNDDASKTRTRKGGKTHSANVMSPMPGKVTKIFANKDQLIAKGDAILVMEAMKMEYTLKANSEGVVLSVNCAVGDQVVLGKILVEIKASEEKK